jgi:hypothetical protein
LEVAGVAIAGAVVAAGFVIGACLLLGTVAKYYYLERFGAEAMAETTQSSTHISEGRHHVVTKWEKLDYNFTAADGRTVESVLDRPVAELANVRPDRFAVVYWRLFPSVNIPKELRPENAVICALALLLLFSAVYFALFASRAYRYQRAPA